MTVLELAEKQQCPICTNKDTIATEENEHKLCLDCWATSDLCIDFEVQK